MNKEERKLRIIARGEHSNHSHVITGDAIVRNEQGEIIIEIGKEGAILKHLLETEWLNGNEVWTQEHKDIDLSGIPELIRHGDVCLKKIEGRKYRFIQQQVFDPLTKRIENAKD